LKVERLVAETGGNSAIAGFLHTERNLDIVDFDKCCVRGHACRTGRGERLFVRDAWLETSAGIGGSAKTIGLASDHVLDGCDRSGAVSRLRVPR
jgi:hypothetical protein